MEGYSISSVLGSLILNLLNIVALFLILRALVYRPVQRFLQARTDRVQAEFDRVAEEKAEAKRLHEAYLDQLSRSRADADAQAAEVLKRAEETVRGKKTWYVMGFVCHLPLTTVRFFFMNLKKNATR